MIWGVLVLVSCVTVSYQTCNVTSKTGQVLQPKLSWDHGARFVLHKHTQTRDECQQGCCSTERCDTILYTGSKVDKKGDNCFYFDCHKLCIFRNATAQESEFSVAVVSASAAPAYLPDFSNMFVSSKPKNKAQKENSTVSHQAVEHPVVHQNVTFPDNGTQAAENEAKSETKSPVQPTLKQPESKTDDSHAPAKTPETPVNATTVKPEPPTTPKIEPAKNKTADTAPVNNKSEKTAPTQPSSPKNNEPVTVKDNEEKPKKSENTPAPKPAEPAPPKPAAKETDAKKDEAAHTEKTKPKLPNEVPTQKAKEKVKTETGSSDKDQKTESEQKEKPAPGTVVVVDKNKANNGTKTGTHVSVEVHVQTSETEEESENKDIVFWVAVVGGATLIIVGLVIVIRYYGNKRRRLYSSLTDDYLINGMYSI